MQQHPSSDRTSSPDRRAPDVSVPGPRQPATGPPSQIRVLALQRLAGNHATTRALARWAAHPDPEKKGVMVPDVVAADFLRFNPPKNS